MTTRRRLAPVLFALGLGLALGSSGGRAPAAPACGSRGPYVWVADRDGDRVTVLDRALLPLSTVALRSPRLLGAVAEGVWVAHAPDGEPRGAVRLVRLTTRGGIAATARFAFPVLGLAADGAAGAFVLEDRPVAPRVWRLDARGDRRALLDVAGARRLARCGERLLVGCARGELVLLDAGRRPALLARRRVGTRIVDLAPRPGGFWALDASFGGRLLRLDGDLGLQHASSSGCVSGRLAAGGDGIWLADAQRPRLLRFGPLGTSARESAVRGLRSPVAALVRGPESLVLATDGAIWLCDPQTGTPRRTQGGFDGIVDLALARR